MHRLISIVTMLGLLMIPCVAPAYFQTGDKQLTLSGSGSSDKDFDTTTFAVDVGFGYFYTDYLQGIVRQNVAIADVPGDNQWNGSTRVGADYNFDFQNWRPFIGATIGYLYGDGVTESFIAGPEAGIKGFVNDTTFIVVSAGYDFLFEDADDADDAFSDGRIIYSLGIGFKW